MTTNIEKKDFTFSDNHLENDTVFVGDAYRVPTRELALQWMESQARLIWVVSEVSENVLNLVSQFGMQSLKPLCGPFES